MGVVTSNHKAGSLQGRDIEEYIQIVDPWDVILRQTSPGRFHGRMDYIIVNNIVIYREYWSRSVLATGSTPPGYFMFGNTLVPERGTDWCGQVIDSQNVAYGKPGSETTFSTPKDSIHAVMLVPDHLMRSSFGEEAVETALASQCHHLGGSGRGASTLAPIINRIISKYQAHPDLLADVRECQAIELLLMGEVAKIFSHDSGEAHLPGTTPRREALHRAIEICDRLRVPKTMPQLAALAGVSQRSLERAFQEMLGIPPRQYLHSRRMQAAHQELRVRNSQSTRVTDVATYCGFTELGRFAVEYKKMFGKSPSETLKDPMPTIPTRMIDIL